MDSSTIVAIVGVVIGALGSLFAMYIHFTTRRAAKLTYAISQISDFGAPTSFLQDMERAPVAITVTSRGNEDTENTKVINALICGKPDTLLCIREDFFVIAHLHVGPAALVIQFGLVTRKFDCFIVILNGFGKIFCLAQCYRQKRVT